jgi:hypothetical protein
MARAVPLLLLLSFAVSLPASPIKFRQGDPAVDGSDYMLSEEEFRVVLRIFRDAIAREYPSLHIRRVHVDLPWVTAYCYRPGSDNPESVSDYFFQVQRVKGGWKINARGPTIIK